MHVPVVPEVNVPTLELFAAPIVAEQPEIVKRVCPYPGAHIARPLERSPQLGCAKPGVPVVLIWVRKLWASMLLDFTPPNKEVLGLGREPTVNAPPLVDWVTTKFVPPVAEKLVVPAGNVIVFEPADAAAFRVIVPLVTPLSTKSPELKLCTPDHVFVPFNKGIVAPLVPVAVEQPVAPFDKSEHAA